MANASKEKGRKPLANQMILCDVETCWNYAYEMLDFAYTYRNAYDEVTANRDMSMRNYEISKEEWKIVKDLADVLKVSNWNNPRNFCGLTKVSDFQRRNIVLFAFNAEPCESDPSYGPHWWTPHDLRTQFQVSSGDSGCTCYELSFDRETWYRLIHVYLRGLEKNI